MSSCHAIGIDRDLVELFTPDTPLPEEYVGSLDEFKKNLAERYGFQGDIYNMIPWRNDGDDPTDRARWLLAGGSALNCLFTDKTPSSTSDLDFFRIERRPQRQSYSQMKREKNAFLQHICTQSQKRGATVITASRSHLFTCYFNDYSRKIQFIWVNFIPSYQSILDSFDHSVCAIGFDGERVICTKVAYYSLINKKSIYDPWVGVGLYTWERSFINRMLKIQRLGFEITIKPIGSEYATLAVQEREWKPDFNETNEVNIRNSYPIRNGDVRLCKGTQWFTTERIYRWKPCYKLQELIRFLVIVQRFVRRRKWARLAKLSKTEGFARWYYHPDNIGGRLSKAEIYGFVTELKQPVNNKKRHREYEEDSASN